VVPDHEQVSFRRSDRLFNKPTTKGRFFIITEFIEYSGRIDTHATALVVEPGIEIPEVSLTSPFEGVDKPLVAGLPQCLGERLLRLQGIIVSAR
jgi:hypothetical protein